MIRMANLSRSTDGPRGTKRVKKRSCGEKQKTHSKFREVEENMDNGKMRNKIE